jgi:hypothetical protein
MRRNCLLKHIIEGQVESGIEVTRRRERRCKKILDVIKKARGYWELKTETLDRMCGKLA